MKLSFPRWWAAITVIPNLRTSFQQTQQPLLNIAQHQHSMSIQQHPLWPFCQPIHPLCGCFRCQHLSKLQLPHKSLRLPTGSPATGALWVCIYSGLVLIYYLFLSAFIMQIRHLLCTYLTEFFGDAIWPRANTNNVNLHHAFLWHIYQAVTYTLTPAVTTCIVISETSLMHAGSVCAFLSSNHKCWYVLLTLQAVLHQLWSGCHLEDFGM